MARELASDARGDGATPLLLLHGFLGSGRNLSSLARRLTERAPHLRCVFPDLTGHGASPRLPEPPTLTAVAEDVVALAARLSPTRPVDLVGHSFGGRTALEARRLAPARVGRIMLLDIAPGPLRTDLGGLNRVLALVRAAPEAAPNREAMRAHFLAQGLSAPLTEWVILNLAPRADGQLGWRIDREALARLDAGSRGLDLWPAVNADTACVRGGASSFVSDEELARFASLGCEVTTLAGAGHFVHVDALEPLAELLARWATPGRAPTPR